MTRPVRYPAWAFFAGTLAAAGLPIYIHAPKFYVDAYGVSLGALGVVLFGLRLLDVLQDPVLGWVSERLAPYRSIAAPVAAVLMGLAMLGLFAVTPPVAPLLWFALTLALLFSSFSFLTITFYADGIRAAGTGGHVRLAAWRETGALIGVSLAAVAPTVLAPMTSAPFSWFAAAFAVAAVAASLAMARQWSGRSPDGHRSTGLRDIIADPVARRLLIIALFNATPVAVTSTLFLFFVESRLAAPGWEGPLLLAFFVSAAAAAPIWGKLAARFGTRRALLSGMMLSIVSFAFAALLREGDVLPFAAICVASGAALGADMTLLPALFARRMAVVSPNGGQAFGLWSFMTKFTLAFAAVTLLPILEWFSFVAGPNNSPEDALVVLTVLYALVPCALKLAALGLLYATRFEDGEHT